MILMFTLIYYEAGNTGHLVPFKFHRHMGLSCLLEHLYCFSRVESYWLLDVVTWYT